ncbi:helix-turn-helix domain-containing protein [Patescibacteria group bacterium]|nr:helix-turn-helix domain-containing protein [Patescibacteria group bacterium]
MKKEVSKKVTIVEPLSVREAAEKMGYTRQHVLRLIQSGQVKARKVGRNFVVDGSSLPSLFGEITTAEKKNVDEAVNKVLKHYSEALKKLSKE